MIWIILLGGMVQGAFAQNLEIKGMVRDARNKEILEFANVVLQTMDSSFVAGTTTDMKGHFLLGNYILLYTISKIIKGHMIMYPFIIQSFFSFFFPSLLF